MKRLLITVLIIIIVAFLIFTLLYFTPGDPVIMLLGPEASADELNAMRDHLGLNDSYLTRLGTFMHQIFIKFDLGESWVYKTNITYEINLRLPRTAAICIYSVLISALIGIPLGVMAAVHQDGIADKFVLLLSSIMRCIPNFWIALMLILTFSLKLGWLPAYYAADPSWRAYVLPLTAIMLGSFAGISRQMRSSMLEVIRSDYVTAARAQGFSKNSVNYRHALPNALIPIITIMGTQFAGGLGGTMILETIFSIPGMGLYIQGAIGKRDLPVITGCVVFLAITFCLIMLLVDVCYAFADPRIRAQYELQGKGRGRKRRFAKI